MHFQRSVVMLTSALCAFLSFSPGLFATAVPVAQETSPAPSSSYWLANIGRQGTPAYGDDPNYQVFRNVKDGVGGQPGAVGDGVTDDTEAINRAISFGNRCGGPVNGVRCDSTTVKPAIVYFPPGRYLVSRPIIMYYYTQMLGDAINKPTIIGAANFEGIAMLDSDPYLEGGENWYTNQNNFFRQVHNFVVDVRPINGGRKGAGIHWQVAQATSLRWIDFIMSENEGTEQQGIFMDNGSGGFMGDLTFTGGRYGAFLGNQQFTSHNLVFNNCKTAIFMNWNWGWVFSNTTITGSEIGIDMSNNPPNQTVGSIMLLDSTIRDTPIGVKSAFRTDRISVPEAGGTLVMRNVDMINVRDAVRNPTGQVLAGGGNIAKWASGRGYVGGQGSRVQGPVQGRDAMQDNLFVDGKIFTARKPQYLDRPLSAFKSVKAAGCSNDGRTPTADCLQRFFDGLGPDDIAYFDHGAYVVEKTVVVKAGTTIVGEIWPLIMAQGFNDPAAPKAVFQLGRRNGEQGTIQISDLMFETIGPNPGAILIEYNIDDPTHNSGLWDTHARVGGSSGTLLEYRNCPRNENITNRPTISDECVAAFMMFHGTSRATNIYLENTWFWVADHALDADAPLQISIYNARGVLLDSPGPIWMWGSASEHSQIYNYQFRNVRSLFSGYMQTETPYMHPNPPAPGPFRIDPRYDDPDFSICNNPGSPNVPCRDAWGIRILNSRGINIYGAGLYSFFNNYDQECVPGQNCQEHMVRIQGSEVSFHGLNTKAAVNMITDDAAARHVLDRDNRSNFCATLAYYLSPVFGGR